MTTLAANATSATQRAAFIDDATDRALETPDHPRTSTALTPINRVDEDTWWKKNPEPQVTETADRLILWNYPVAKTELVGTHQEAIRSFTMQLWLDHEHTGGRLSICGHASPTGEAIANVALATGRAQNVAAYLAALGFKGFEVTAAGSSQPADSAPTGQAMARNRRVELTKSGITEVREKRVPIDKSSGIPSDPSPKTTGKAFTIEYEGEFQLDKVSTKTIEAVLIAVVKGKVSIIRGGDAKLAAGLKAKDGSFSATFEKKLAEHLKGKIGIEPGRGEAGTSLKVSLADNTLNVPIEVGFQNSPNFFFLKVTLPWTFKPLKDLEIGNTVLRLELNLDVKIEVGPSKALLLSLGIKAGPAGAAAIGVVAVAAVIIGGTIYASDVAKVRMLRVVADLAERDGAASQIAYECFDGTERVAVSLLAYRQSLTKHGGTASQIKFESGRETVTGVLSPLKDKGASKVSAWKETFAKGLNETDFDTVRKRVLDKLSPYEDNPPPLRPLIEAL